MGVGSKIPERCNRSLTGSCRKGNAGFVRAGSLFPLAAPWHFQAPVQRTFVPHRTRGLDDALNYSVRRSGSFGLLVFPISPDNGTKSHSADEACGHEIIVVFAYHKRRGASQGDARPLRREVPEDDELFAEQ